MRDTPRNVATDDEHDDARADTPGLYIQMFSMHGLIRGRDLELGRDADTGGQTKYVVELARHSASAPRWPRSTCSPAASTIRASRTTTTSPSNRSRSMRASCGCAAAAVATAARSCCGRTSTPSSTRCCASTASRSAGPTWSTATTPTPATWHGTCRATSTSRWCSPGTRSDATSCACSRAPGSTRRPSTSATTSTTASASRSRCCATPTW
jgi:hypothetical protein